MDNKFFNLTLLLFCLGFQYTLAQTNIEDSLLHQNFQRLYTVHLPPTYSPTDTVPVLIFLHGGSGSSQTAQGFTLLNFVSNSEGFLAVYPQGYGPSSNGGFTWADGRGTSADKMGIDDVGYIQKLIDSLLDDYPIDPKRIYLAGFSNGGFLTQRIACTMNDRLAAVAFCGATMGVDLLPICNPNRPIPALIFTGTADPLVPYQGGPMNGDVPDIISSPSLFDFWANNNNCQTLGDTIRFPDIDPSDTSTVDRYNMTDCDCGAEIQHLRVNGGGHTWPGVENVAYEELAGQTNEDISGSRELWNFFKEQELCFLPATNTNFFKRNYISAYPNPSSQFLRFDSQVPIKKVICSDLSGRILIQYDGQTIKQIDISALSKGTYHLHIYLENGLYLTKMLFKN